VSTAGLADRLLAIGPLRLLYGLGGDDARKVWDEAGEPDLSALALDADQPTQARFLAAELLADRAPGWVPEGEEEAVAQMYVRALREQVVTANRWGLPGTVGPAGAHLLDLGAAARSALQPVLDDDTRVEFSGSREVALGRRAHWRVRDIAATLLASATGADFPADAKPARRDQAADSLREEAG
jgi:hypothetical protein